MQRQDYKEAAEKLLARAEKGISTGYTPTDRATILIGIAHVYALLAAIPDEKDTVGEILDELKPVR